MFQYGPEYFPDLPFRLEITTKSVFTERLRVKKPNMDVNSLKDPHLHCSQISPFISIQ